jgi:hypothetical protein
MLQPPDITYLRRKQRQHATAIPVCLAMAGLAAYGCHELELPRPMWIGGIGFPLLLLAIQTSAYYFAGRRIKRLTDDCAA